MSYPARLRRAVLVCLLPLVAASCTESDSQLFEDVGLTRLYPTDPSLGPPSLVTPEARIQAVRWAVATALVDVEGVASSTDLAPGGDCEIVATSSAFPRATGACSTGFVLTGSADPVNVQLSFSVTSMEAVRARPLDLSETVDYDGDGVPNDGDGSGSAFDNPCGLVSRTGGCDDNCPLIANPSQKDDDANGVGQACTTFDLFTGLQLRDSDADGVADGFDNCVWIKNPGQEDVRGLFAGGEAVPDGVGDVCPTQMASVELDGQVSFTLDLGPEPLLQPVGLTTFVTVDFANDRALDCDWEIGSCTLEAAEVRLCASLAEALAAGGCP